MSSDSSQLHKRQRALSQDGPDSPGIIPGFSAMSQRPMTYKLPTFSPLYQPQFGQNHVPSSVPVTRPGYDHSGYVLPHQRHVSATLYHSAPSHYDLPRTDMSDHSRSVSNTDHLHRSSYGETLPPSAVRPPVPNEYYSQPLPRQPLHYQPLPYQSRDIHPEPEPRYPPTAPSFGAPPYVYPMNPPRPDVHALEPASLNQKSYTKPPDVTNVKSVTNATSMLTPPTPPNVPTPHNQPSHTLPNPHISTPKALHTQESFNSPYRPKTAAKRKSPQDFEESFVKFIPLLQKVSISNFGAFLVEIVKDCHETLVLDDLYNLLYNSEFSSATLGQISTSGQSPKSEKQASSKSKPEALNLCSQVLETFKNPQALDIPFHVQPFLNSSISSVSFHELLRTFLAIKIIFSSLKEVQDSPLDPTKSQSNIPRMSVYKVYYIICQKLIHKYPNLSNSLGDQQNIIVGQSKLGKLTKLAYPDLAAKRLGSRGNSKYHYINVMWNDSVVDEDVLKLLALELPELREHYNDSRDVGGDVAPKQAGLMLGTRNTEIGASLARNSIGFTRNSTALATPSTSVSPLEKPLYSYVGLSCTYPKFNCSPRSWETAPDHLPHHSQWATDIMDKSLGILKMYNVNFGPLIANIKAGKFSEDGPDSLSTIVPQAMKVLSDASSPKDTYLHIYRVVLFSVLPAMLASDQEIPSASKVQLRVCVTKCITRLESEIAPLPTVDEISLSNFIRTLRKMAHISELTSTKVDGEYRNGVLKQMVRDLEYLGNLDTSSFRGYLSPLEDILVRSTVMALNAYRYELIDTNPVTNQKDDIGPVLNIARSITKAIMMSTDTMLHIASSSNVDSLNGITNDVPYQVFRLSIQLFHRVTLAFPSIAELPIPIITYIMINTQNEMQKASFPDSSSRDPELVAEALKTWWIFSTMFQEYMGVISEVAGLSETLDKLSLT